MQDIKQAAGKLGGLSAFSMEVILQIIQHLDMYGVISFLEAFPEYKRYAMLVTDHRETPMFFNVEGVERRHFISDFSDRVLGPSPTPYQGESPFTRAHPIRLFEFAHTAYVMNELVPLYSAQDKARPKQNPNMNTPTSFVFLRIHYYGEKHHLEALTRRLDEFTVCKWHAGYPTSFENGLSMSRLPNATTHNFSNMFDLRLENVPVLKDMDFPLLEKLSLVYTIQSMDRPVVDHIVAKRLQLLVVHYSGEVPIFKRMSEVATRLYSREEQFQMNYMLTDNMDTFPKCHEAIDLSPPPDDLQIHIIAFELAHIQSLSMGATKQRGRTSSEGQNEFCNQSDFSFIERFPVVHLFGVPESVVQQMPLHKAKILRLLLTQRYRSTTMLDLTHVECLTMVLNGDNLEIPLLYKRRLIHLWLFIRGERSELRNLFRESTWDGRRALKTVSLYSSTTIPPRPYSTFTAPCITHEDWKMLWSRVERERAMKELTIIGFYAPFLTLDPSVHSGDFKFSFRNVRQLVLRPMLHVPPYRVWELDAVRWNQVIRPGNFSASAYRAELTIAPFLMVDSHAHINKAQLDIVLGKPADSVRSAWFHQCDQLALSLSACFARTLIPDVDQLPVLSRNSLCASKEELGNTANVMAYTWVRSNRPVRKIRFDMEYS